MQMFNHEEASTNGQIQVPASLWHRLLLLQGPQTLKASRRVVALPLMHHLWQVLSHGPHGVEMGYRAVRAVAAG